MRKFKWWLHVGYAGCELSGEFEVDDETTDSEISKLVEESAFSYIDLDYTEVFEQNLY